MMLAGDNNKLVGEANYHVWRLQMRSMLRRYDLWEVTINKIEMVGREPVIVNGVQYNEIQLKKLKSTARAT